MPDAPTIRDYDIHVYWDNRSEYFVAEIPEIPTCAADGATQAEAVSNLGETFAVLKEAYAEEKLAFPRPNPELPISVQELSALSKVVKISRLAELSGIPGQTLATKLKRGTQFDVGESRKIARALEECGIALRPFISGQEAPIVGLRVEDRSQDRYSVGKPNPGGASGAPPARSKTLKEERKRMHGTSPDIKRVRRTSVGKPGRLRKA
jgi:predicted RNase H-like HicB family nuclease